MKNRILLILMVFTLAVMPTVGGAQEDRLQVVASFSILEDVVRNVAGDAADVSTLIPVNADPHSFTPSPRDLIALADADVVFTNGALFEEGLLEAIENADTDMNIVEASLCVNILAFGGEHDHEGDEHDHEGDEHEHEGDEHEHEGDEHEHEGDEHEGMSAIAEMCAAHQAEFEAIHAMGDSHEEDHEEDHEEAHEEGEEHAHAHGSAGMGALYTLTCTGHDHGGEAHSDDDHEGDDDHGHSHAEGACNPHVWMEPHNVMRWTMVIRDTLIGLDPANAETYTANAEAYILEIDGLMHDVVMPLVETLPEENRVLVTNHDAFGYFADRFEFEVVTTVLGSATTTELSAADVAEVIDTINDEGVTAIFAETSVSDRVIQQIANEAGADIYVLYTGSLSDADGPAATFVDYTIYNVTTIVEALGGGQ